MISRLDALMGAHKGASSSTNDLATEAAGQAAALDAAKDSAADAAQSALNLGKESTAVVDKLDDMGEAAAKATPLLGAASGALSRITLVGLAVEGVARGVRLLRDAADSLSKQPFVTETQRNSLRGFTFAVDGIARALERVKVKAGQLAAAGLTKTLNIVDGPDLAKAGEQLEAAEITERNIELAEELAELEEELADRRRTKPEKRAFRQRRIAEIDAEIAREQSDEFTESGVTEGPKQQGRIYKLQLERLELELELERLKSESEEGDTLTGQVPQEVYQNPLDYTPTETTRREVELLEARRPGGAVRGPDDRLASRELDTDSDGEVSARERGGRRGRIRGYTGGPKNFGATHKWGLTGFDLYNAQQAAKLRGRANMGAFTPAGGEGAANVSRGGREANSGGENAQTTLMMILQELKRIRTS
jgi:hypothetical protein